MFRLVSTLPAVVMAILVSSAPADAAGPTNRELIASCRAALVRGGDANKADGVARVSQSRQYVFIGGTTASCKFAPTSPPQLTEVYIGDCYECGITYAPDMLSMLNELLRQAHPAD